MEFIKENKNIIILIIILAIIICSLITFLLYYIDKQRAKRHKWRIKEITLLTLPWLFGSLGGLFGIYALHHKNKHWYFIVNNTLAFIAHFIIIILLIFI